MATWGSVNIDGLKRLQRKLSKATEQASMDKFYEDCAKELAARFLALVIKDTPVRKAVYAERIVKDDNGKRVRYKRNGKNYKIGDYRRKKRNIAGTGGTLKRGWTSSTHEAAAEGNNVSVEECINSMRVEKHGRIYKITIFNPVKYAWYVEYGHMIKGGKGWVGGRFMMTKAKKNIRKIRSSLIQSKLESYLRTCFNA